MVSFLCRRNASVSHLSEFDAYGDVYKEYASLNLASLARIFRPTVSFLSAQFRHKMVVKSEPSPLDISFPAINSRFKQALVNFRLKSFFVIALVQSKQICTFDRHRRKVHTFDDFGRSELTCDHRRPFFPRGFDAAYRDFPAAFLAPKNYLKNRQTQDQYQYLGNYAPTPPLLNPTVTLTY